MADDLISDAAESMAAFLYGYTGQEEFVPWDSLASDHPVRRSHVAMAFAALVDLRAGGHIGRSGQS